MNNINTILTIVFFGLLGGAVNVFIVGVRRFRLIRLHKDKDRDGIIFDFGWIGQVLVGGASAFIVWSSGLGNPEPPISYALAILSGLLGATVINSYTRNRIMSETLKSLIDTLEEELKDDNSD